MKIDQFENGGDEIIWKIVLWCHFNHVEPLLIFRFTNFQIRMRDDRRNLIVEMTTEYALKIIDYVEQLESERKYVVAKQVLRSGTSIGANVREAQNAESKADFIHKFKIAAKEADELAYWLELCKEAKSYPDPDSILISKLQDIQRVVSKIISSSKTR